MVGGIAKTFNFVQSRDMTIISLQEHVGSEIVMLSLACVPLT
jgi:hypothetical protein